MRMSLKLSILLLVAAVALLCACQQMPMAHAEEITASVVTLTNVGAGGDQYIDVVGWNEDCTLYATTEKDDFELSISADGTSLTSGSLPANMDLSKAGPSFNPGKSRQYGTRDPDDPDKFYHIFYEQFGQNIQEPRMHYCSAKETTSIWRWWRTYYTSAVQSFGNHGQGDARGIDVIPMRNGRFVARTWADCGLPQTKDPRDILTDNCACAGGRCGCKDSMLIIGQNSKSGEELAMPLHARKVGFRPARFLADDDGRILVTEATSDSVDPLGLGGKSTCGITVYDQSLDRTLYSAKLGCEKLTALSVRGTRVLVGGHLTKAQYDSLNSGDKLRNRFQSGWGGGDTDAFFAVLDLSVVLGSAGLSSRQTACTACYCPAAQVSVDNAPCSAAQMRGIEYPSLAPFAAGGNRGASFCQSHAQFGSRKDPAFYIDQYTCDRGEDYDTVNGAAPCSPSTSSPAPPPSSSPAPPPPRARTRVVFELCGEDDQADQAADKFIQYVSSGNAALAQNQLDVESVERGSAPSPGSPSPSPGSPSPGSGASTTDWTLATVLSAVFSTLWIVLAL